jgi:adenosylcobinamide-GDP ribazoletransferase
MIRGLATAWVFLTRVPLPLDARLGARDVGRSTAVFPLVGAALGGIAALLATLLASTLPPLVVAVLVVAALTGLTGALHLDGLADAADGFGGGESREDTLRIMREPAIGAFGAVALILDLVLKIAALTALLPRAGAARALIVAGALSRWTPVALGAALPYARKGGGLGASLTDHAGRRELVAASLLAGLASVGLCGQAGLIWWGAAAGLTAGAGWLCRRRLGGVTGDTLGATVELAETLIYVLALVVAP